MLIVPAVRFVIRLGGWVLIDVAGGDDNCEPRRFKTEHG
jgi:hypothetical protein